MLVILFLVGFSQASIEGLPKCSEEVLTPQICLYENSDPFEYFFDVKPSLEIIDISDVNENDKTMTLFVYMLVEWWNEAYDITGPEDQVPDLIQVPAEQMEKIKRIVIVDSANNSIFNRASNSVNRVFNSHFCTLKYSRMSQISFTYL